MQVANDNDICGALYAWPVVLVRPGDDEAVAADDPVLPPDVCRMLDECDRVGIGMDMLMTLCRAKLRVLGADKIGITEEVLTAFQDMIERRR